MTALMTATPHSNAPRRAAWIAALLITVVAVALHLRFLNHAGGLWRDEVNLVNLAGHSALADMAHDSFPVLMPLTVHGWLQAGFGKTDFGLRCLGALIGFLLLASLWLNSWTMRRAPPLVGLALFALNSTVIIYGDSLRGFGLASLFIVLTATAAWRLLQKSSLPRAAFFALAAILSVQSLYQNAVLIGAICCGMFVVSARRKSWKPAALIVIGGLLSAISLAPYFSNLFSALRTAANLRTGFQPDIIYYNLTTTLGFPMEIYFYAWVLLAVVVIAAGCFAANSKADPAKMDAGLFAGVTLLAALAGYAGFFWFVEMPTQPWYFLPLLALAAACFDAGLPSLPRRFRAAGFGLVLATALAAAAFAWRDMNFRLTNVDVLAQRLAAVSAPEDFVAVNPWYCGIGFGRYFKSATQWDTLPPLADHSGHRYDLVQAQMKNPDALAPVLEKMAATLRAGHRVWVVGWLDIPVSDAAPPKALPPPPLKFSGWSDTPYAITWAWQAAHFLRQHARTFEQVKLPPFGVVNPNEDLKLFVAEDRLRE